MKDKDSSLLRVLGLSHLLIFQLVLPPASLLWLASYFSNEFGKWLFIPAGSIGIFLAVVLAKKTLKRLNAE